MSVPGQALASLGLSWVSFHFARGRFQTPQPLGEGSRPCLRTAAGPTAQWSPFSACSRAALVLLGGFFCSLFHVRGAAFTGRSTCEGGGARLPCGTAHLAPSARAGPSPRPLQVSHRAQRDVTPSPAASHSVIGCRRAETAPPPCTGGLAGRAGGAWLGVWG